MVVRHWRFHPEVSLSNVKEVLMSYRAAQRTQNMPSTTSSVLFIASTPKEQPPETPRCQPRTPCSRCGN
jgi:hypothetical protein